MLTAGTAEAQRPRRDWHRPRLGLLPQSAGSSPTSALGSPSPTNRLRAHPRPGAASKSGRTDAAQGGFRGRAAQQVCPPAQTTGSPKATASGSLHGGAGGSIARTCHRGSRQLPPLLPRGVYSVYLRTGHGNQHTFAKATRFIFYNFQAVRGPHSGRQTNAPGFSASGRVSS